MIKAGQRICVDRRIFGNDLSSYPKVLSFENLGREKSLLLVKVTCNGDDHSYLVSDNK